MASKNIGSIKRPEGQVLANDLTVSDLKRLSQHRQNARQYRIELGRILSAVRDGYLTVKDAETEFRAVAGQHYGTAFTQGKGLAASVWNQGKVRLSPGDQEFLDGAVAAETQYFKKFMQTVRKFPENRDPEGAVRLMPYDRRLDMYRDTLDSMLFAGTVASLHPDTPVWWELSPECDHCRDCLALSAASPWTVGTLPTTPRAGGTECKSHCCCHLRFGVRQDKGEAPVKSPRAPAIIGPRPDGTELPDSQQATISDLFSRMNYHRQMAEALKAGKRYQELDPDVQSRIDLHLQARKAINQLIIRLKTELQVSVKPAYSVGSLLARVDEAVQAGRPVIEAVETIAVKTPVMAISNTFVDVGTVTQNSGSVVSLMSAVRGDVTLYRGRSLFFGDAPGGSVQKKPMSELRSIVNVQDDNLALVKALDGRLSLVNLWIRLFNESLGSSHPEQEAWMKFKRLYSRVAGRWQKNVDAI